METPKVLSSENRTALMTVLRVRFEANSQRHAGIDWSVVRARLDANPNKLWSLAEMERTGGESDVVAVEATGILVYFDCSPESPVGRRSVCYDRAAQEARKENKPVSNALDMAVAMGVELLTEDDYRALQRLGSFDSKTSSWVVTPPDIRLLDGALFGDYRYGKGFIYHNGASSYYASRGFRCRLTV